MFRASEYHLIRRANKTPVDAGWPALTADDYNDHRACGGEVGLVCASPGDGQGIYVLDIDVDKATGQLSQDTLEALLALCLPETLQVQTPSGGTHYFFQTNERLARRIRIAPGIDFLGYGGYVALYEPLSQYDTDMINALPHSLRTLLLQSDVERPITLDPGGRNNAIASLAGSLLRGGVPVQAAHDELQVLNAAATAPLQREEVAQVVASISRYHAEPEPVVTPTGRLGVPTMDIRAKDIEPLEQLCGPFMHGCVYIIAGPPGVAKSFWILHFLHQLAVAGAWQDWTIPKPRRSLILDGEMTERLQHGRLQTVPQVEGVDIVLEDHFTESGSMPIISRQAWQDHFSSPLYTDYYDVFVFDTTSSLFDSPGDMKSTDAEYWGQVSAFNRKMRQLGKTLIYVDHTTGYKADKIQGSYSKLQGIEVALMLTDERESLDDPPVFHIHTGKNRIYVEGSPGFGCKWWWSGEFKCWYRGPIPPPEKGKNRR